MAQEPTIEEQLVQASVSLDRMNALCRKTGGVGGAIEKLQAVAAGNPAEQLTPAEAALCSWAIGLGVQLTLATEQEKQKSQPVSRTRRTA